MLLCVVQVYSPSYPFFTHSSTAKLDRTGTAIAPLTYNGKELMDRYVVTLQDIAQRVGLPSRIKFMIQDVIDLRKKGYDVLRGVFSLYDVLRVIAVLQMAVQQGRGGTAEN